MHCCGSGREMQMPVVKVNKNFQVTIPSSVRKELGISAGDFLEATTTKDGILYKIKDLVDRDISNYWRQRTQEEGEVELSEGGRKKVEEALAQMEQGQTKEFDDVDDLIKDLNQ
jgi:AbrB family looped-hinge helix DNA binding protein